MILFKKTKLIFSKLKKVRKSSLEDFYWTTLFGVSKQNANKYYLRQCDFKDLPSPIFFLSTGRCGTNWFEKLLTHEKSICVFHEPTPNLAIQGKLAYELNKREVSENENTLLKEIFLTAREEYFRHSFKSQKRYVETNNHLCFFAQQIAEIIPNAKFVHLYRHPGEFVRSALNRDFYTENNIEDIKRIISPNFNEWNNYNQIEKCGWLWSETNQFIEDFKTNNNVFSFNFNELSKEKIIDLCKFLELNISESTITKLLHTKTNVQKTKPINKYKDWPTEDKNKLKTVCNNLASKYNYQL